MTLTARPRLKAFQVYGRWPHLFICPLCAARGNVGWVRSHAAKPHKRCRCGRWFVNFRGHLNRVSAHNRRRSDDGRPLHG